MLIYWITLQTPVTDKGMQRVKMGARRPTQVSHKGGSDSTSESSMLPPRPHISRKLESKVESETRRQKIHLSLPYGYPSI